MSELRVSLPDADATEHCGALLAEALGEQPLIVGLDGELGSGKTTLARAVLRALGVTGRVRSPTFTLVEPYELPRLSVYHIDLYRLTDPEELEYLGVRDFADNALVLVEWPQRGGAWLMQRDLDIRLEEDLPGRVLCACAGTERGHAALAKFQVILFQDTDFR